MKLNGILKCMVLLLPLSTHAVGAISTDWNIDDPTGSFVGSFTHLGGGLYENVDINATDGTNTEQWYTVNLPESTSTFFESGGGAFYGATLYMWFAESLDVAAGPVATDSAVFFGGSPFSSGSFSVTMAEVPDYERPQPPAVPLPGAVWLFGSALVGLAGLKRRKV
jgi:hypothetical protein